jgi:hypothetical protein
MNPQYMKGILRHPGSVWCPWQPQTDPTQPGFIKPKRKSSAAPPSADAKAGGSKGVSWMAMGWGPWNKWFWAPWWHVVPAILRVCVSKRGHAEKIPSVFLTKRFRLYRISHEFTHVLNALYKDELNHQLQLLWANCQPAMFDEQTATGSPGWLYPAASQRASGASNATTVPGGLWRFSCLFYPFLLLSNYATQSHRFQWFLYHILFMISLRTCRHVTHKYLYKKLSPCIILRFLIIPPHRVKKVRNRLVSSFDCFPNGFQTTNPDHQLTFCMIKMLHIRSSCGCKVLAAAVPL